MESKPTQEQLESYYYNNRSYFDSLANYYYKNDKDFYTEFIHPFYSRPLPAPQQINRVQITCPFCHQAITPNRYTKISTGGWVMIVIGLIFTPILLGIILIFVGISMKDSYAICPNCKMRL